jgi:hypothetical protein
VVRSAWTVTVYVPSPRRDSGSGRGLDVSFVIAPRSRVEPSRRATATYWATPVL